ncbi:MAG: biotin carboxylase N-terminal domain-containing protein, partial [Dehalococcoidia bacterium]
MPFSRLLIANRGEIAVRIARAAADLGIPTVAVFSEDDARSLHVRRADSTLPLAGRGPAAYLDADQIVETAVKSGCDALHPGYGFLSERASFAAQCREAGITFVGPRAEILELFGDKARARAFVADAGVAVLAGTSGAASLDDVRTFFASLPAGSSIAIKAVAGGGGRGLRIVDREDEIEAAFERCQSEARAAFGNG